jgi:MarR family transcriptional regulator, organic hydroperoxide resistance regulator
MADKKYINRKSLDLNIKAAWLAITKMYNTLGIQYGITHSNGFVLLNIDPEKGVPATRIAPMMGMEAGSLTRMLKGLEDEGWIYRQTDADDKRKVIVYLTAEGKQKRELARLAVREFNKRLREQISPEKMEVFFDVIETAYNIAEDLREHAAEEVADKVKKVALATEEVFA